MRLQKKSLSKISLTDLLRKKRSNLASFLKETGIFSYELLVSRCVSIGVVAPPESEFLKIRGNSPTPSISSPTEGIVVLDYDNDFSQAESRSVEEEQEISPEEVMLKRRKKNRVNNT